jgi:hypothetical protein
MSHELPSTAGIAPEIRRFIYSERMNIYGLYDIPPEEQGELEERFADIEELARDCRDKREFDRRYSNNKLRYRLNMLQARFSTYGYLRPWAARMLTEDIAANKAAYQATQSTKS